MTATTGIITTIVGTGASSYSGDGGQATSAGLGPYGVTVDSSGIHYFTVLFIYDLNVFGFY